MKKRKEGIEMKKKIITAVSLLIAFVLWTVAVCFIDVKAVGPRGSRVGLSTVNVFVHDLSGVNLTLYGITDWLGLVPVAVGLGFAVLGLVQWIRRKSLKKVDRSLLALGGFYVAVAAAYLFFESCIINYRPVLISGKLEASYPSSTTLLVLCIMPTAAMQAAKRIKNQKLKACIILLITAFTAFMVIGRLLSGVHWLSDIIGGILLSATLITFYLLVAGEKQY